MNYQGLKFMTQSGRVQTGKQKMFDSMTKSIFGQNVQRNINRCHNHISQQ